MTDVYESMQTIYGFRLRHTEPGEYATFFVDFMQKGCLDFQVVRRICRCPGDEWVKVVESVEWMEKNTRRLGLAHGTLSEIHDVVYVLHAAHAIERLASWSQGEQQAEDPASVAAKGACWDDVKEDDLFTSHFNEAYEAKLKALGILAPCMGIWHAHSVSALEELTTMSQFIGKHEALYELQSKLQAVGVDVAVEPQEDGGVGVSFAPLREIDEELGGMTAAEQ